MCSRININWSSSSCILLGVLASKKASGRVAGVGVQSCTSSFDRTMSGWSGTRPAPQKAEQILACVNDRSKAALKAGRNSSFVM
jgi:hypothetical protein